MAEISVDTGGMRTQENHLQTVISRLEKVEAELGNINSKIAQYLSSQAYQNIRRKISQASGRMEQNKRAVQSLKEVLHSSRDLYQNTENNVESYFRKSSGVNWSQTGGLTEWTNVIDIWNAQISRSEKTWSGFSKFWNDFWKKGEAKDALYQAAFGVSGSIFGKEFTSKITGKILDASLKRGLEATWDIGKGEAKIAYQVKGEVKGADLKVETKYGIFGSETEIGILTGAVSGEAYCALLQDGEFAPGVGLKGKIGGSVLSGKQKFTVGSDDVNAHITAKGDVLTGEMEGSIQAGKIKTEDGSYVIGAEAKGEMGAYLAKGEVKGGFDIFGIEIDASLKGKLGFGVDATAGVTSNSATVGIGAAILGGGGFEIKVDWSKLRKKISSWRSKSSWGWGNGGSSW